MITAQELNSPILIYEPAATAAGGMSWSLLKKSYGKLQQKSGRQSRSVFSPLAVSAPCVEFTVRSQDIGCRHCIVPGHDVSNLDTERLLIIEVLPTDSRHFISLRCAKVLPVTATRKIVKTRLNEMNNPVRLPPETQTLEGWLTEKYLKASDPDPMAELEGRFVLILPAEAVRLAPGDILEIGGAPFAVLTAHLLNPDRAEYEVVHRSDA